MGGLDGLKETAEEGPLKEQWELEEDVTPDGITTTTTSNSLQDRLQSLVNRSRVMLFMKGCRRDRGAGFHGRWWRY